MNDDRPAADTAVLDVTLLRHRQVDGNLDALPAMRTRDRFVGDEHGSGLQSLVSPGTGDELPRPALLQRAFVPNAVVKAVLSLEPQLDCLEPQPVAAPERRPW